MVSFSLCRLTNPFLLQIQAMFSSVLSILHGRGTPSAEMQACEGKPGNQVMVTCSFSRQCCEGLKSSYARTLFPPPLPVLINLLSQSN